MEHTFDVLPQLDKVDETVQALRVLAEPLIGPQHAVAFEVAVSEAVTNVVVHGYDGNAEGDISVSLTANSSEVEVRIRDHGTPGPKDLFDRAPPLDEIDFMQESGRGLALIRHHSDAVTYTPSTDGNLLVLWFRRSQADHTKDAASGRGKDPGNTPRSVKRT